MTKEACVDPFDSSLLTKDFLPIQLQIESRLALGLLGIKQKRSHKAQLELFIRRTKYNQPRTYRFVTSTRHVRSWNFVKQALDRRYFVDAAAKVLDILESFGSNVEELSVTEVARRTCLTYSSAFRLLYTLEKRGYIMRRSGKKRFLLTPNRKRFRIGYAALGGKGFGDEVSWSIISEARRFGITLLTKNNEFSPSKALANVDELLAEKIDLLIEYQLNETASHLIAAKCHSAGIPSIAINFAQPGAYYFGGDNYKTGFIAAEYLCQAAQAQDNNSVLFIVFPAKGMGSTQEVRKAGFIDRLTKGDPPVDPSNIHIGPPVLTAQEGYRCTKKLIQQASIRSRRLFIALLTDPAAIGAEKAIKGEGLQDQTIIIGEGGAYDTRARILKGGPFKASVAFFPERYGERVLSLALKILGGEKVSLASYTNHVVLTAANLKEHYPDQDRRRLSASHHRSGSERLDGIIK